LGSDSKIGPRFKLARENRSRRNLHASQEKSKKEKETLTVKKDVVRTTKDDIVMGLSREAPFEGLFRWGRSFAEKAFKLHTNFFNFGVVGEATSC